MTNSVDFDRFDWFDWLESGCRNSFANQGPVGSAAGATQKHPAPAYPPIHLKCHLYIGFSSMRYSGSYPSFISINSHHYQHNIIVSNRFNHTRIIVNSSLGQFFCHLSSYYNNIYILTIFDLLFFVWIYQNLGLKGQNLIYHNLWYTMKM